jgi:hypothetical protein
MVDRQLVAADETAVVVASHKPVPYSRLRIGEATADARDGDAECLCELPFRHTCADIEPRR